MLDFQPHKSTISPKYFCVFWKKFRLFIQINITFATENPNLLGEIFCHYILEYEKERNNIRACIFVCGVCRNLCTG